MDIRAQGLTTQQAARLLAEHGPNALPAPTLVPFWLRFLRQFKSPLIYMLLFAVTFDVGVWVYDRLEGLPVEGIVIAVVLLLNAVLGTYQEYRSEKAIARLETLSTRVAWVLRDGKLVQLPSRDLVPGDLVRIEGGERVPADGALFEGEGLLTDEAVLTGESVPVEKAHDAEIFSGTLVVRGKGVLRVTRTGKESALGKIAMMLVGIKTEKTPLERRLDVLGKQVAICVSVLAVLLVVAGVLTDGFGRIDVAIMFAVALAVAAIPEGMPADVTLTL
jgi:Ca2+-transporting ATPase